MLNIWKNQNKYKGKNYLKIYHPKMPLLYSVAKSCPTLCNFMDCSSPGSPVHGISKARILEWVALSYSRECSQFKDRTHESPALTGRFFTSELPVKPHHPKIVFFLIFLVAFYKCNRKLEDPN